MTQLEKKQTTTKYCEKLSMDQKTDVDKNREN